MNDNVKDTRNVIVHYHIFKNAGSSVDQLLKRNFPDRWISHDKDSPGSTIAATELHSTIVENPQAVAFSSHQIVPPLPAGDYTVYPIVFLRDPVDRIKSAYLFEWKKQLGLDKPKGSFKQFVESKFERVRKSSVEEFQTLRLANVETDTFTTDRATDEELIARACAFIDSLDFVGIVDRFDESKDLLQKFLQPAFPEFEGHEVQANVLQDISVSQERKRRLIQDELGDELFEMIVERNKLDEKLYQYGNDHFNKLTQANVAKTA